MSTHPFTTLFEAHCRPKGTLAVAVRDPRTGSYAESYAADIQRDQVTELWPLIDDSFQTAEGGDCHARRIRFLGRHRELHCFRRDTGAMMMVLLDCSAGATKEDLAGLAAQFDRCAVDA